MFEVEEISFVIRIRVFRRKRPNGLAKFLFPDDESLVFGVRRILFVIRIRVFRKNRPNGPSEGGFLLADA